MQMSKSPIISGYVKIGRQTTYALLGSGLHTRRGMSPIIALQIWRTDLQKLERLQLKILKQFQGLSERIANVGVYSLLGIEPIEGLTSWRHD